MPFIKNLWVATLTDSSSDSGFDSEPVLIMNQNGLDVVHRDLGDFGPPETGGGTLYVHDISEAQVLPQDFYMRIGTRSSDLWRPSVIAAWCERFTTGNVVPLGYNEGITQVLSTDSSEGRISLPLRQPGAFNIRTGINRVMMVTGSLSSGDMGTDSPIHVRITAGATVVVDHTIPDTSQDDLEGGGNVYFLPVISSFTRSQLTDASIVLSIEGRDAWRPIVVVMFGLDTAAGQPAAMVPLVHVHPWPFGNLSMDLSEGVDSRALPLALMDI